MVLDSGPGLRILTSGVGRRSQEEIGLCGKGRTL